MMEFLSFLSSFKDTALQGLAQALETKDLYIALLLTGVALGVGLLGASLTRRVAARKSAFLERIGALQEWNRRATRLLTPLYVLLLLIMLRPLADTFLQSNIYYIGAVKLSMAWLACGLVFLMVETRVMAWFISAVVMTYALLSATGAMKETVEMLHGFSLEIGKFRFSLLNLLQGAVIFVLVFWMAGALSRLVEKYLRQSSALSYNSRELIVKFFRILVYFIAFVITLGTLGVDLTALAVFGGALGVGIGLGLQKITSNFVSGIIILLEKSVKIGDLIEIDTASGWVRQLQMRYTLLETFDGRELLIPNEELISSRVTNWTYSNELARIEIKISVAYDSDAKKAQELMLEAALAHPLCLKEPAPWCYLREFADSGLLFALTFWIPDVKGGRFGPQSEVMFAILEKFKQHNIEIPYPHQVVRLKRA